MTPSWCLFIAAGAASLSINDSEELQMQYNDNKESRAQQQKKAEQATQAKSPQNDQG